jgi:hypothetical protein
MSLSVAKYNLCTFQLIINDTDKNRVDCTAACVYSWIQPSGHIPVLIAEILTYILSIGSDISDVNQIGRPEVVIKETPTER